MDSKVSVCIDSSCSRLLTHFHEVIDMSRTTLGRIHFLPSGHIKGLCLQIGALSPRFLSPPPPSRWVVGRYQSLDFDWFICRFGCIELPPSFALWCKVAIVRFVRRKNSEPWLGVLIPDTTGAATMHPRWLFHKLPFSEDVRDYTFPSFAKVLHFILSILSGIIYFIQKNSVRKISAKR